MTTPCKDCPSRHTACHDTCERYKAYKTELDAQRAYTRQMSRSHSVYHVGYREREYNLRREHPFGQK